jgi:hypothetical protein
VYSDLKVTVETGSGTLLFAVNPESGKLELTESRGDDRLWIVRLGPDSLLAGMPASPEGGFSIVATMTKTPEPPKK